MTIANPIYDTVFKYLMEDPEIAKGILSTILNVEIEELNVKPQETIAETEQSNKPIRVYRIDFAAVIKEKDGTHKKILIELQKAKRNTNILRFRRYLAENYQKEDVFIINGVEKKQSLEIVTIYILGFSLENVPTPVLYVKNCYTDVMTGKSIEEAKYEEFIRLLKHESYTIQIPRLPKETKTKLEEVLSIFNQVYRTGDEHILNYPGDTENPLIQKILQTLFRAIADEDTRRRMDIEDEIDRDYQELENKLEIKDKELEIKDKELEIKDKELEIKDKALEIKDKALEEKEEELVRLRKLLAAISK